MTASEAGQVTGSAAEVYEEFFLPALFQQWASRVADAAEIQPGQRVLDVACGTGVLARHVATRVGASQVVGLDLNEGMLAVARQKAPGIEWRQGRAEALPFGEHAFDAVVSQFGLMFFDDRVAALREAWRVLRPGGRLAVAVWDSLEQSPGYAAITDLTARLFGEQVAAGLRSPFVLGDRALLRSLFEQAQVPGVQVETHAGTARYPSLEAWIYTDIKGWTAADALDDERFALLLKEAERELSRFVTADGSVVFEAPAHIATAAKS